MSQESGSFPSSESRVALESGAKGKALVGRRGQGQGSHKQKRRLFQERYFPLQEGEGEGSVIRVTSLNAGQEIPGCFKMPLVGEAVSAVTLGTWFWFAHEKIHTNDSIWGLSLVFFNHSSICCLLWATFRGHDVFAC